MFNNSISENILWFIAGFGTIQGILLALIIYFHPKSDRSVNIFLALFIVSLSLTAFTPLIYKIVGWQKSYYTGSLPLLPGPFLYLYVCSFKKLITWKKALPHFIPFLLFTLISYFMINYLAGLYPGAVDLPEAVLKNPASYLISTLRLSLLVIYCFLARRTLFSYQRSLQQLFSDTSRINLDWVRWLINGFLIIVILSIILVALMFVYPAHLNLLLALIVALLAPYFYLAAYKGITQPTIWQNKPGINKEQVVEEFKEAEKLEEVSEQKEKTRQQKAGLFDGKMEEIAARIVTAMEVEKLFQETELTLQNLADKLSCPSYQISLAINDGLNKNFYDLVNGYRVEEAKKLLLSEKNRNYTILSVGFEAGFNSKTTFNTVFKKFTGFTPSEFRSRQTEKLSVNSTVA